MLWKPLTLLRTAHKTSLQPLFFPGLLSRPAFPVRTMSVFNSSRLAGKTVLVTGASSGIGAASAVLFAKAGCSLVLLARRTDKLQAVKTEAEKQLQASGKEGKVMCIEADMQKSEQLDKVLDQVKGAGFKVDILLNNAGMVFGREHVGAIAPADIATMVNTNVIGLIHLTQIFVREFKAQNSGHIINLGSVAGREPYAGGSIYCATKAALASFTNSLMRELVATPIRVSELQPGMVETEFSVVRHRGDKAKADNEYKGLDPLTGEDIAEEIVWIASRPAHVNIAQTLVFPVAQAGAGLSYRRPE